MSGRPDMTKKLPLLIHKYIKDGAGKPRSTFCPALLSLMLFIHAQYVLSVRAGHLTHSTVLQYDPDPRGCRPLIQDLFET